MIQKEKIVSNRASLDLQNLINRMTKGETFNVRSRRVTRTLDTNTASLDEVANVLATLINDLIDKGIIQK